MYFSFWYKPSERALRIGIFHASNAMASGVGGFLANGINNLNGAGGLPAWRWVFIVSGTRSASTPCVLKDARSKAPCRS